MMMIGMVVVDVSGTIRMTGIVRISSCRSQAQARRRWHSGIIMMIIGGARCRCLRRQGSAVTVSNTRLLLLLGFVRFGILILLFLLVLPTNIIHSINFFHHGSIRCCWLLLLFLLLLLF